MDVSAHRERPDILSDRVHSIIRSYVNHKTEVRSGKSYEMFKTSGYRDHQYVEANNKVCMDAFLAIRGRKDHRDFVSYFTGTICSVPQFLTAEQYREFSVALLNPEHWEDIKSLSLLALSALSQQRISEKNDGGVS